MTHAVAYLTGACGDAPLPRPLADVDRVFFVIFFN